MFRGNHPAKIDDKFRLKVPGPFKKQLDAENVTEVYITSTDGVRAQIWPILEWEKQEKKLAAAGTGLEPVDKYLNWTSFYGAQVEIDTQGRVTLPQLLREKAKLEGEVAVFGKLKYLEIAIFSDAEKALPGNELTAADKNAIAAITKEAD